MRKRVRLISVWTILGIGLLSGCSGQETVEEELKKEIVQLEKKIVELERLSQETEEKKKNVETETKTEAEEPLSVSIVDPETKEVIRTIDPVELGYSENLDAYKQELAKWARELARGTEDQTGYDKRMYPDKISADGSVVKGTPRVILEEKELVDNILALSDKGGEVELPLYTTASGYAPEDASVLNEVVIASYTTHYNAQVAGRTKNIELSTEAIHQVIVGKDDIFSFNTTVGPSDEAHGYQPAEEAVNGKLVMGIGGGICQTSSTLFNAVDQLAVEYVEKHNHSVTVGYVPVGRDATVSYGGLDFRFQNTAGAPFLIHTVMKDGQLTVEIRTAKEYESILKKRV
ncbi:VanW family protein [Cytobacillus gottheilii]|uniref:VanW family protein n=1 Tax=Cytobacillus gottheilii TaxID=859144 RepID=UPI0009BBAAC1|nr:VanW family protein [Cytobacillus gottheilii]